MQDIVSIEATIEQERPIHWDDYVGHENIIFQLQRFVNSKRIDNLLFLGDPGIGKTSMAWTVARYFVDQNGGKGDILEFNASDNRGIDFIRNEIENIKISLGLAIIILDEGEHLTEEAQHALRRIAEQLLPLGKFMIITANTDATIIDEILSRFKVLEFANLTDNEIYNKITSILDNREIFYKTPEKQNFLKQIIQYIAKGDMRKAIQETFWYIEDNEVIVDPEYLLYRSAIEEFENILEQIVIKASYWSLREDIVNLMYKQKPSLKPFNILRITDKWIKTKLTDKEINEMQYNQSLVEIKECDYRMRMGTDKYIQIIGMLAGLRIIYTRGLREE